MSMQATVPQNPPEAIAVSLFPYLSSRIAEISIVLIQAACRSINIANNCLSHRSNEMLLGDVFVSSESLLVLKQDLDSHL